MMQSNLCAAFVPLLLLQLSNVFTECERQETLLSQDSMLLQSMSKPARREHLEGDDLRPHRHLPLCDPLIVEQTCGKLGDSSEGVPPTQVSWAALTDLLSTDSLSAAQQALELPEEGESVGCMELCSAAVEYVRRSGKVLPPFSNIACRTFGGNTTCDVDVDPEELTKKLGSVLDKPLPDVGPMIAPSADDDNGEEMHLYQLSTGNPSSGRLGELLQRGVEAPQNTRRFKQERKDESGIVGKLHYEIWEIVERIANLFCVYPSLAAELSVSRPQADEGQLALEQGSAIDGSGRSADGTIATRQAQAKAWVATIIREMSGGRAATQRRTWFGGAGSQSAESVRQRIGRTMNFIQRELTQGMRYIYPADNAKQSPCRGGAVAYVWRAAARETTGYQETTGPRCRSSDNAMTKNCGLDEYGRYYVYLCSVWMQQGQDYQISVLVHEAAHHAGPNDVTGSKDQMKRNSQYNQLMNAGNYQYFSQDVVQSGQGCSDTDGNCQFYRDSGYCSTSNVRAQCARTCGACGSQPAPAPACADTYGSCQFYKDNGYCSSGNVQEQCRRTCGLCR